MPILPKVLRPPILMAQVAKLAGSSRLGQTPPLARSVPLEWSDAVCVPGLALGYRSPCRQHRVLFYDAGGRRFAETRLARLNASRKGDADLFETIKGPRPL